MKNVVLLLCFIMFVSAGCSEITQSGGPEQTKPATETFDQNEGTDSYAIIANGDLEININAQRTILEINALPDGQIIQDDGLQLLLLSDPTEIYRHGILGDELEATSVTLISLSGQPAVIEKFNVPDGWVIESILPIWSDWDGNGEREIILTLSNSVHGSKLVLYDESGNFLAESEAIGKGYRWRHALDIGDFGNRGERLLVEVMTPHIGGIVGFYSWDKGNKVLVQEGSISGYSTHDIGSRDMGMYAFIEDENSEQSLLILPTQSKTELAALRFDDGVIHEMWRMPLGGKLSSDLELMMEEGSFSIRCTIDDNQEVVLKVPD